MNPMTPLPPPLNPPLKIGAVVFELLSVPKQRQKHSVVLVQGLHIDNFNPFLGSGDRRTDISVEYST